MSDIEDIASKKTQTLILVPKIPAFYGDGSLLLEEFLAKIKVLTEVWARNDFHPPKAAELAVHFHGRALLWYTHTQSSSSSAVQLMKNLKRQFGPFEMDNPGTSAAGWQQSQHYFRSLIQHMSAVPDYAAKYKAAARKAKEDVNSRYNRLWFVWGLRPLIRARVIAMLDSQHHTTFDALVLEAVRVERAQSSILKETSSGLGTIIKALNASDSDEAKRSNDVPRLQWRDDKTIPDAATTASDSNDQRIQALEKGFSDMKTALERAEKRADDYKDTLQGINESLKKLVLLSEYSNLSDTAHHGQRNKPGASNGGKRL